MSSIAPTVREGYYNGRDPRSLPELANALRGDVGEPVMSLCELDQTLSHLLGVPELFELARLEITQLHFDPTAESAHELIWTTAVQLFDQLNSVPTINAICEKLAQQRSENQTFNHGDTSPLLEDVFAPGGLVERLSRIPHAELSRECGRALIHRFLRERDVAQPIIELTQLPTQFGGGRRLPADFVAIVQRGADRIAEVAAKWGPLSEDWPAPESLHGADLPAFPLQALPLVLRNWVLAEAAATQTPPDLAAMLSLAVVAAAGAKQVEVLVNDGWREPINIFVAVVLEPGNRKSAVLRDASEPLKLFEREQIEQTAPQVRQYESTVRILTQRQATLERSAARESDSARRQEIANEAAAVGAELSSIPTISTPKCLVDDCTVEQLEVILSQQLGRVAILSAEGGVFTMMKGRYGDKPVFDVYLKGHSGEDLRTDRVGRPSVFVPCPAITLGLAIQPEVVSGLGEKGELRGKGLLARFLYAIPQSLLGRREIAPPSMPESVRIAYRNAVLMIARTLTQNRRGVPHDIALSPSATERFRQFVAGLEPKLSSWGEMAGIQDWAGKLAGAVIRIAGLLHLVQQAEDYNTEQLQNQDGRIERRERLPPFSAWATSISEVTMASAISIAEYAVPHAHTAFRMMGLQNAPTAGQCAQAWHAYAWIRRERKTAFSKRDLYQANRSRFPHADDADPILEFLIKRHIIRIENPPPTNPKIGRPISTRYRVNPAVHELPQMGPPSA